MAASFLLLADGVSKLKLANNVDYLILEPDTGTPPVTTSANPIIHRRRR